MQRDLLHCPGQAATTSAKLKDGLERAAFGGLKHSVHRLSILLHEAFALYVAHMHARVTCILRAIL